VKRLELLRLVDQSHPALPQHAENVVGADLVGVGVLDLVPGAACERDGVGKGVAQRVGIVHGESPNIMSQSPGSLTGPWAGTVSPGAA